MKVLITGDKGYIGQHLKKMLLADGGFEVYGLDIDTCDIRHYDEMRFHFLSLMGFPNEFDVVIHLAALVRVGDSVRQPLEYYDTNINGTINVLRSIKTKNFIFASTGVASNPVNPYALSKRCAEDIVQDICGKNGIDYTIFRFYNVIGSDGFKPTNPDGLMYALMRAKEIGAFNLYGIDYNTPDGTAVRDYVHVNDICKALKHAIKYPSHNIENLGTGKGHTVKEMIEVFKKVNNCDFEVRNLPRRNGDLETSVLDKVSSYMVESYTFEELMKI